MRTSVTLQVLLFAAGATALAQSSGIFTPAVNPAYPDLGGMVLVDGRIFYGNQIYDPASGILSNVSGNLFAIPGSYTRLVDGRVLITEYGTVRAEVYDPV